MASDVDPLGVLDLAHQLRAKGEQHRAERAILIGLAFVAAGVLLWSVVEGLADHAPTATALLVIGVPAAIGAVRAGRGARLLYRVRGDRR